MIDKLITVKEFLDVLDSSSYGYEQSYRYLSNYIELLEQPLKLEVFVPCFENKSLAKPKIWYNEHALTMLNESEREVARVFNDKVRQYQQAEEKVLFKGFEWDDNSLVHSATGFDFYLEDNDTVKILLNIDLPFCIELTEEAKRLITL